MKKIDPSIAQILILVIILTLMIALTCCTSVRYVPIESSTRDSAAVITRDTVREVIHSRVTDSVNTTTFINQVVDTLGRQLSKETVITREIYHNETELVLRLQRTIDSLMAVNESKTQEPVPVETKTKTSIWSTLIPYLINIIILAAFALYLWRKKRNQPP
jgi:ATP-dependent Zn protease